MNKRPACKINGFKYPVSDQIGGRTSTVCRSMACTLLNRDACSPKDEKIWMIFFPNKTCAYCGKPASHLDHLYALVDDRKPTGYGTEPANLVPCCTECNQPKGNLHWEEFMRSDRCHHVGEEEDKEKRIECIKKFQEVMPAKKIIIDDEIMGIWITMLAKFDEMLNSAQETLIEIKKKLYNQI